MEKKLFDSNNIENIEIKSDSDLHFLLPSNISSDEKNQALPPYRKYTIPNYMIKENMQDLR